MDIEFDPNDPSKMLMLCDNLFYSTDTGRTWWQHQGSNQTTSQFQDLAISDGYGWLFGYHIYSSRNPFDPNTGWYLTTVPPIYPGDGGIGYAFDVIDSEIIVVPGYIDQEYGNLILGHDFDVVDNTIVIPGQFSE